MLALVLAFTVPGEYSLDRVLGLPWMSNDQIASLAIGAAVALMIAARHALVQPAARAT